MARVSPAVLLLVVLVSTAAFLGPTAAASPFLDSQHDDLEPDRILIEINVSEGSAAEWTISHRHRLADENESAAFSELADEIATDPAPYRDRFRERMEAPVATAEETTGREMEISNLSVSTERRSLPQEYGIVHYQFRWDGFADERDDRLLVGDAIYGLFLDDRSTLVIRWDASFDLVEVAPSPSEVDDRSATWRGPVDFADDQPRLELDAENRVGWLSMAGGVVVVVLVAVIGVGGLVWRRQASSAETAAAPPDDDLLSNEEQVLRLLESEGGRMKQQDVVERLDWTDAKTSQVVSDLREDDRIETFRLGRENVIRLPEEE